MTRKRVILIDAVLLVFLALSVFSFVYFSNSGKDKEILFSPQSSLFEISSDVEYLLVDDNLEFSTPRKINLEDKTVIEFSKGTYYIKIPLEDKNDIRRFTIGNAKVRLIFSLDEENGVYRVASVSEKNLEVDVSQYGSPLGTMVLGDSGLEGENIIKIGGEDD